MGPPEGKQMIRNRLILLAAVLGLLTTVLAPPPAARAQNAPPLFRIEEIELVTLRGRFALTVEVAETDAQRSYGLQFREQLPPNRGMLFNFETPQPIFMWMKNTLIPLDMVFINEKGRVASVAENTKPLSLDVIPSGSRVLGVLEVAAGTAARLGITKGALIRHRIFGNTPSGPGTGQGAGQPESKR